MQVPAIPANETARIERLYSLRILDTPPEERFDRLTRLAKRMFNVPMALVSLVDTDRQWFKSKQGLAACETPRDVSFCGHAIQSDTIFEVSDARADVRFADNPLVTGGPHIRFYAGCPLSFPGDLRIGTLCLLDVEPRHLSEEDRDLLRDLARMAQEEIAAVQMATMDHLTQLSNRRGFDALARHVLAGCKRLDLSASLFFFDLDHFKAINDRFGHAEGDQALVEFAALLRDTFRESDVIGRLGGDEFVVLLSNATDAQGEQALHRLHAAVAAHNAQSQRGYALEFSVGVVPYHVDRHGGDDPQTFLDEADQAMYQHKLSRRAGRS